MQYDNHYCMAQKYELFNKKQSSFQVGKKSISLITMKNIYYLISKNILDRGERYIIDGARCAHNVTDIRKSSTKRRGDG